MSMIEEIKEKFKDFKAEQGKRRDFKKQLDFEKYKAVEIAKAKAEVKAAREGKLKKEISADDLLGYDIHELRL